MISLQGCIILPQKVEMFQVFLVLKIITYCSAKISEFFEKSPLSEAEKHHIFPVTSCHQNDTTNADFAYSKSEIMSFFVKITIFHDNFLCVIGLSKRYE